jgi:hydroxyacylglutathione hydrolase
VERLSVLVDEGLGNCAYLLDPGDGRGLAVDPSLDLRAVRATAAARNLRIAYVAETHLHADFLSAARQLARDDGAEILASTAGGRLFGHRGLDDGDEVDLGGLTLRALATPGHTSEHLAFLLLDGGTEIGVFTGGSLIVGGAARTDLVSPDRTVELARAQYRSLRCLATLPDTTAVWPTHGAGSFCSAPSGAARSSSIGTEKASNTLLAAHDEDTFVDALLASLGSFPAYFCRLSELNRYGQLVAARPALPSLDPRRVRLLRDDGAVVVDVRPVADFAAGHVPGSVSIVLRPAFASWLGWLLAEDARIVIVRNPDQDPDDILWPAVKVGYHGIVGELTGGIAAWVADGQPVVTTGIRPAAQTSTAVLDIRQDAEYEAGHLPGSYHVELGALPSRVSDLPTGALAVMCEHGERAATAASLLERAGRTEVSIVVGGGPEDWSTATGRPLAAGR